MHRTDIKAVFANLLNQLLLEEGGTFPLFRKNIIPIELENREITAPTKKKIGCFLAKTKQASKVIGVCFGSVSDYGSVIGQRNYFSFIFRTLK